MKLFASEKDFLNYKKQFISSDSKEHEGIEQKRKNMLVIGSMKNQAKSDLFTASLMDKSSSYIVFDEEGLMLSDVGNILKKNEYDIKVINFSDPKLSEQFNPLLYINETKEVDKFSRWIIYATSEAIKNNFFETCEALFYKTCLFFLMEYHKGEKNLRAFKKLVQSDKVEELLEQVSEFSQTGIYYKAFCCSVSPSTKISILTSCRMRVEMLFTENVLTLTDTDTLMLNQKYAVFINPGKFDSGTHKGIIQLLFAYLNKRLEGDHARFLLKDFQLMGIHDELYQMIEDKESMISFSIGIESISQLKELYGDYIYIMPAFDDLIYLDSEDDLTHEFVSKRLGFGVVVFSEKKDMRPIMNPSEVAALPKNKMLIFKKGEAPVITNKYDIHDHLLYVLTGLADVNNRYDWISAYKQKVSLQNSLKTILLD